MKIPFRIILLFLLLPFTFCINAKSPSKNLDIQFSDAFSIIYLSHFGLNYPPDERILSLAIKHHDRPTLKTFNMVMDAKQFIRDQIRLDANRALDATLDHIFRINSIEPTTACEKDPNHFPRDQFAVTGAVISLYFFQAEEQDRIILERIRTAAPKVLKKIFRSDYEWLYNRPSPERWIAFVEAIPEDTLSIPEKKNIIDTFKQTTVEKFGIMLDRPAGLRP